jgi:hypothetical protein
VQLLTSDVPAFCRVLHSGALEAMFALGWVHDEANAEELVVREGTYFSMKEVSGTPGLWSACLQ